MSNNGILYEDDALLIRYKEGFLANPQSFAQGTGIEHIIKNAVEVKK